MTPLERELVALAPYLDHGDGTALSAAVARRLTQVPVASDDVRRRSPSRPVPPRSRSLMLVGAAAAVVALVLTVTPARRAVARLFRIGAVEIRPSGPTSTTIGATTSISSSTTALNSTASAPAATTAPPSTGPPSTASTDATIATTTIAGTGPSGEATTLDDARRRVAFAVRLADPAIAGAVRGVTLDGSVPGGLVAIAYDAFTLVQVASVPDAYPVMAKMAPEGVTATFVTVDGRDAVWVEGAHEIVYLAPNGAMRTDTMRRSGSALVWTIGDVTLRVEGLDGREQAIAVADSVR